MPDIPPDAIAFEIHLTPDDSVMADFNAWLEREKARLEAGGLTVTDVTGATFTGYYFPESVDQSIFDA